MAKTCDVVVLGGGAAGLSAALYSTRAMLKTVVLENLGVGGQLLITDEIENYPGFPEGETGQQLAINMQQQAERFGAEIDFSSIEGVSDLDKETKIIHTDDGDLHAKAVIIATGGSHKTLGIPGEDALSGKGVSYCAVCDGNFFKGQDVVVIGGGDAAMDESN